MPDDHLATPTDLGTPTDPGPLSRRGVLRTAAAALAAGAAASLAAPPAAAAGADTAGRGHDRVPRDRISIQLYTLRDQLAADLAGTLAALHAIGYRRVEHAGFVGRTAAQFRAALDAVGLRATSGHVGIPQPFNEVAWQAALADARVVGSTYVVHPFFGLDSGTGQPIRSAARYRDFARDLNRAGALARRAGLRFGYHNHQLEFLRTTDEPGRTGYDILTAETDPELVHLEIDLFWAFRGAADPVDLIARHRGRIRQVHVKDLATSGSFEDPGRGLIDFGRVFAHAGEAGLVEYIVERDDAGTPPRSPADALSTARVGFEYLSAVRF
ncbi:sugar phosphate isomerase/epimerase family protein [Planosporangium mesophilum]|uniref:Xylose isomerase n=1 Tax=Planosporangium mesophilum TaxID=689768 RepID=A0A8J3T710_9ACTN|nr:sugar phosphate isomerase/epimerase [Planosporangium mesophilum]NJC85685.1 TIM barrel protein [Planosporangium mesophilum]GII21418.1 xylose isomerase [Planosporangium mesophilum]